MDKKISLQINLAPTDLPHARHILPHQLKQWAGQVDEILLVVDLHQSRGRFSEGWQERLPGLRLLIDEYCAKYPQAHSLDVDYSEKVAGELGSLFLGGHPLPVKDYNGAPFYSYFFALYAAKYRYILHMDSDMLFGGGSPTWIAEAMDIMNERPDILICNPLPGPPTKNGVLRSQLLEPEPYTSPAFRASGLSTRIFLLDRERLFASVKQLPLLRASGRRFWQAVVDGNPPYEAVEDICSHAMMQHGLIRFDFLGADPGMWSVHPPYRSQLFYDLLPTLIEQVESGNIPDAQRGCHDINTSMIDWAGAKKPLSKRITGHLRLALRA